MEKQFRSRLIPIGIAVVLVHVLLLLIFVMGKNDYSHGADGGTEPDSAPENISEQPNCQEQSASGQKTDSDKPDNETLRDKLVDELSGNSEVRRTYVVRRGDSLMKISKKFYGSMKYYKYIFEANKEIMKSPSSVRVGQTLVIPPDPEK